jgi:pimeloyl-ACP methyl ester carboxylesterase
MKKFEINGHEMAYLDVGQGSVVIFGHAYLMDSSMWVHQVEALKENYRCIIPDFWGHGVSDSVPKSVNTLKDYAKQVNGLLDSLDIYEFSVVGLSLGGIWGAELASLIPQRVKSLVLMDTFVGLEPEISHKKFFTMLDFIEARQAITSDISEDIASLYLSNSTVDSSGLGEQLCKKLANLEAVSVINLVKVGRMFFGRRDQTAELEKLSMPVLITVGQQDKLHRVLESYLMQDCLNSSELIEIPNAGHLSNLEQPEIVTNMLERFLARS